MNDFAWLLRAVIIGQFLIIGILIVAMVMVARGKTPPGFKSLADKPEKKQFQFGGRLYQKPVARIQPQVEVGNDGQ